MFSFLDTHNSILPNNQVSVHYPTEEDIPKSAVGYHTNNRYNGFPPLMADGRSVIGSWQPESYMDDDIVRRNNIKSNWEYRQYLVQNAKEIITNDFAQSANDIGYYGREIDAPKGQFAPMQAPTNIRHYGTPALYQSADVSERYYGRVGSDLKANYLSREELAAQRIVGTEPMTQADILRRQGR